jgi:hypothetical protein
VAERILIKVESELETLMPRFLANRRRDLETIAQSLATPDFERLRKTGHDMKGVGGGYGFERISDLGAAIEAAAARQDSDELVSLMRQYHDFLSEVDVVYV